MITHELTNSASTANIAAMRKDGMTGFDSEREGLARQGWLPKGTAMLGVLIGGAMALSGCVSVNAPDKPIVIELNINIKAEVVHKLAADAQNTVQENSGIF